MNLIYPVCGDHTPHERHLFRSNTSECPGWDSRDEAETSMIRTIEKFVSDWRLTREPLPEGTHIRAHPSVINSLMKVTFPDFSVTGEKPEALFDIPIRTTIGIGIGEWRLVLYEGTLIP